MAEIQSPHQLIRFGAFEADLRTSELCKDGVKLKFSGQPFQVLAILLERPGEVVTREELQKRLWPDTFVDVERNLNTAVNKIREVLGDSAESPRFVETLPRRGYRFIAELEIQGPSSCPVVEATTLRNPRQFGFWWKIVTGALGISLLLVAGLLLFRAQRRPKLPPRQAWNAVPFTALPGLAQNPAFSPDGSRIAFAWIAAAGQGADLFVKALGSETLLRLTRHPAVGLYPVWSPDGTEIAFERGDGTDVGIYVVPALGGPERLLRSTRLFSTISWSPDGKWIAFADMMPGENQRRVYLLSLETHSTTRIPQDPTCSGQDSPVFSHNGRYLAYWCHRNGYSAVPFLLELAGGTPKIVSSSLVVPNGLTWSADDAKLIFSNFKSESLSELTAVSIVDGSTELLGLQGISPVVSPVGDKLAYSLSTGHSSLWRRDLLQRKASPIELTRSSRPQYDAQYSPDGRHIAFASERSGVQSVWISDEDGNNVIQISDPEIASGSPQWSPDGKKIVFDSWAGDIYIADLSERKPRRVPTNISFKYRPSLSHDGNWIYFVSGVLGKEGVYRCPAAGGNATVISTDIYGLNPKEAFDGKTLYFASAVDARWEASIKRASLSGQPDTESEVDPSLHVRSAEHWVLSATGIYFVPTDAPRSVRFFEFATSRARTLFEADNFLDSGLSLSPGGRWILYSQSSDPAGDIMLVSNFH
jgi:Tol biopolymer transport system component/DNA-binding winged helix-turn-helix (wHTH) protein